MKRYIKILLPLIAIVLIALFYIIDRRIKLKYEDRMRHAQAIKFLVENYYYDHQKMPSSIGDLEPLIGTVAGPFNGNLELFAETGSKVFLQEREERRIGLFHKRKIVISVIIEARNGVK